MASSPRGAAFLVGMQVEGKPPRLCRTARKYWCSFFQLIHTFTRCRPAALEAGLVQAVIQTLHNVIKTQGTTWSIPLLQPIALGVLLSAGYVFPPRDGSGRSFNCSLG